MARAGMAVPRAQAMIEYVSQAGSLRWYTTQEPAMASSDAQKGMFVWSRDDWRTGTKQYASCSLAMIRRYMYNKEPGKRNLFEIIRECGPDGTPVPAKIHMDCDIDRDDCADFVERGAAFHAVLEADLRAFLVEHVDPMFGDRQKTPLLCMDSSSATKFSMHYVMGGAMFYNNYHVGALMRAFREHVASKYGEPDAGHANPYFFENARRKYIVDGRMSSFVIDMIYTRHRAFRMLGNCKYGKNVMLLPVGLDRAKQNAYVFGLGDMRKALVQDPVLAEEGPVFSVREMDGSAPQSKGISRTLRNIDGAVPRGLIARRVNLATEPRGGAGMGGAVSELRIQREYADAICAALCLAQPRTRTGGTVKYRPWEMMFIVPCDRASMYCHVAERYHTTSACYYVLLYCRGEYRARCHKTECAARARGGGTTWPLTPRIREAIEDFLGARACTARPPVDAGGLASMLLDIEAQIPGGYVPREDTGAASDTDMCEEVDLFVAGEARPNSQNCY